jgi:hypothetical protein
MNTSTYHTRKPLNESYSDLEELWIAHFMFHVLYYSLKEENTIIANHYL